MTAWHARQTLGRVAVLKSTKHQGSISSSSMVKNYNKKGLELTYHAVRQALARTRARLIPAIAGCHGPLYSTMRSIAKSDSRGGAMTNELIAVVSDARYTLHNSHAI